MLCRDVMKTPVVHCFEHESSSQCARRMSDFNVGFLPVVDGSGTLVGVVTDRDLALRILGRELPGRTPVRDAMSRDVTVCRPEDDLRFIEDRMVTTRKRRLVVVNPKSQCVGVIALSDIARMDSQSRTGFLLNAVSEPLARPTGR